MILGILLILELLGVNGTFFTGFCVGTILYKSYKKFRHGAFFVGGGIA